LTQSPCCWVIYCSELFFAIEIDGSSHESEEANEKDKARQYHLEALGIKFLRFTEKEVRTSVRNVLEVIEDWIIANAKATHLPKVSELCKNRHSELVSESYILNLEQIRGC
jgi:hypothetical protein